MIKSKAVAAIVGIALVVAIGAMAGRTANASHVAPVGLGTAGAFSILAGTPSITNTGATTIDRNVGIHPAASITGFPPGIIGGSTHAGDAVALQAKSDLVIAYNDAAGRTGTVVAGGALGGLTLVDGVYNSGASVLGLTGTLTLDGQNDPSSVWIFQAQSSLVTASSSSVSLINGASACNVFWQVTSSATLGSSSTIVGTIMALQSVTLANGVTVLGRALARNGNVTLINDTFITGGCAPQTVFIPPTRPPFTVAPSATPTVAPTATPIGGATPAVAPTATPGAAATPVVAVAQRLPSTSTGDPFGPLLMLGIALMGTGILVLRRQIRHS